MNNGTANQLAPQAELGRRAFHTCTALRHISLELSEHGHTKLLRSLPECCFLEASLAELTSLTEVHVPPTLLYIARRAFGGCTQLNRFERTEV